MRAGAEAQAKAMDVRGPVLPAMREAAVESEQDPLLTWEYLLVHLRSLLRTLPLTKGQTSRIAWHVKSCRYSAGDLIVKEGALGDFWALVVRGTVAARSQPETPLGRLASGEPEVFVQAGSGFGEAMLLRGEPSQCTYRAASDVELFVLRRTDLVSVMGEGRMPPVQTTRVRRNQWVLSLIPLTILVVAGILLGVRVWRSLAGATDEEAKPTVMPAGGESVRLISPTGGAVVQSGELVEVQALAATAEMDHIELLVDGQIAATQPTAHGASGASTAVLAWRASGIGAHTLLIQGYRADGSILRSGPVRVTVVPAGKLVFSSNRSGVAAIYAMNSDGSGVTLLTTGPGESRHPSMRNDGVLAFVTDAGEKGSQIRSLAAAGTGSAELMAGSDPAWSPSGNELAFARSADGISQVFVARSADWEALQVTSEGEYAGQPAWSPDGERLAYVAERGGNLDIWVVDAGGGEPVRLTDGTSTDWAPAWSPDGDYLAFVSDRSGQYQVYVMRIEQHAVAEQVTAFPLGTEAPTWSPDGYWLAVVAYAGDGVGVNAREIYLVTIDGEEPVRLTTNGYDDAHPDWVLH